MDISVVLTDWNIIVGLSAGTKLEIYCIYIV